MPTEPDVGGIARWMDQYCSEHQNPEARVPHMCCAECISDLIAAEVEAALRDAPETKFNNICEAVNTCDRCDKDDPDVAQFCVGCLEAAEKAARVEALEGAIDALEQIDSWSRAYPLTVFPEPDLKLAAKVLKDAGLTLDAISASAMRHVVEGVGKIARTELARLRDEGEGDGE